MIDLFLFQTAIEVVFNCKPMRNLFFLRYSVLRGVDTALANIQIY